MNILILGLGCEAFGRERRATRVFKHTPRINPFFLISKWEDGSVGRLLAENGFEFSKAPFGYLGRAKPLWTFVTLFHIPQLFAKIVSSYLRRKCQLILFLSLQSFVTALVPTLFLKFLIRAKIIFYLGDIPEPRLIHRISGYFVNLVSDKVIVNSQAVKTGLSLVGIDEGKTQVVYNGLEVEQFGNAVPFDYRKDRGWPPESILVGFVGQLTPKKGIEDFLTVARLILQNTSRCRFLIIGEVSHWHKKPQWISNRLREEKLEDWVAFTGRVEAVERAFASLDVLLVPSRYEDPAPNVAIEATAAGVPVIATRAGGLPEIVVNNLTGILIEKGDIEGMKTQILRLSQDFKLRKEMGEAGKKRAGEMFDIYKNAILVEKALFDD